MNKPDYVSYPDWKLLLDKYNEKELEKYFEDNYPYQYLIGNVEFFNSIIKVDENVLIPRFETEQLVDRVIKKLDFKVKKGLDICTGSGCIAVSLSKYLNIPFDAIDISDKALEVAKENILNNNVKVDLFKMDVLKEEIFGKYDLIVCNPPYVSIDEEVGAETKYEPKIAIFGDNNGLVFYETLLSKLNNNVNKKYLIAMEIGSNQKDAIYKIANNYFKDSKITFEKDLNNRDRYLFIYHNE